MTVIDLQQAKLNRAPHRAGPARCLGCGHEWTAVAQSGETRIECPECKTDKGVFQGLCYPQDGYIWRCNCGNELFLITPDGELCPACGVYVDGER
jgi:Zn finger protein HypA/HybF involved in hydrogenase expression